MRIPLTGASVYWRDRILKGRCNGDRESKNVLTVGIRIEAKITTAYNVCRSDDRLKYIPNGIPLMSLISSVGIAKIGTKSLRTTVPEGIVAFMGIKEGDKLEWRMDIQDATRAAIVKKESQTVDSTDLARLSMKEKRKRRGD